MMQEIQNRGSCRNMIKNVQIPLLGPPGPTENDFCMRGVVMFGLEMLGLVNFDKRKCFVHQTEKNILFSTSWPASAHRQCLPVGLLVLVVIFCLEMLGLVHFDN